ncbi:MAG: serine/threonine-protein kinase, partial [Kofleriaceae bacterium]
MPQSGPSRDLTTTTTVLDQGPAVVAPRLVAAERYVLLEQIGAGAMGVVYAAYDSQLDRKVALKLLPEHLLGGSYQDRLRREARALAQLSHPNVVPVYDVGETGGRVFFTMEFVRGQTAATWVAEPRSIDAVLAVGRAAAAGLAAAHAIGLVHRDVKPSNLLIGDDGRVRIADFGLAYVEQTTPPEGAAREAATGFAGSPAYMAPEQLRAGPIDARCDQFALCVTLYELLNGRRPFTEATIDEQLTAIEAGPPPVRSLPAWLTAAIARGLSADPAARFADLSALGAALVPPRSRRSRWWIAAGGLALAAGVAGIVIATRDDVEPPPAAASCEREAAAIDATWTPARRDALRERVSGDADDRARIAALLDDYAASWRQQREAVCHAARIEYAWSPELAVRATHCLEDRRDGFDRMLGALLAGRDPIDPSSALAAMTKLRTARTCGDPDYLRSTNEIGTGQGRLAAMPELEAAIEELELAQTLGRKE